MAISWLKPDWEPEVTIEDLPLSNLFDLGIEAILLDVDGTLLPGKSIVLPIEVKDWVLEAQKNFSIHLFSNNPSKKRIGSVAKQLGINFTCGAAKPRTYALLKVMAKLELKPSRIAIIGDRVFTDILVGNRLGIYTILVEPINKEGLIINNKKIIQKLEKKLSNLLGAHN